MRGHQLRRAAAMPAAHPAAWLDLFQIENHAMHAAVSEIGDVERSGLAFCCLEGALVAASVIPVQLRTQIVGLATATRRHIMADRLPAKAGKLLGLLDVNIAV